MITFLIKIFGIFLSLDIEIAQERMKTYLTNKEHFDHPKFLYPIHSYVLCVGRTCQICGSTGSFAQ